MSFPLFKVYIVTATVTVIPSGMGVEIGAGSRGQVKFTPIPTPFSRDYSGFTVNFVSCDT
jgi:hypothetical protein